jgi:predicted metal-dependent peptidase
MLMIGKTLTAQQRLHKAVVDIMASPTHMAIGPVLMVGSKRICPDTPTAYTDGMNEVYGEQFVDSMSDAEFRFVVLHEAYHKLYQHLTTWRHLYDENPPLANAACDFVINLKLLDADEASASKGFIRMPEVGGLIDEKYRGMDAAQVFNLLKEDCQAGGRSDELDGLGGFDSHGWEDAKDMPEEERKQLQRDLDSAVRQGALLASKRGAQDGACTFEDLLQPQIDWREQLREFVQTVCSGSDYSTWRRPNRRYLSAGHYLPSGVSETMGELVVAVDTSGSIGQRELTMFLSELASICEFVKPERLRLLYWDTEVASEEIYEQAQLQDVTKSTKPRGGGGTDVECVPEYLTTNGVQAQAVIVFTDGYLGGSWGTWSVPVLWCILGNASAVASVGKTVHIEDH